MIPVVAAEGWNGAGNFLKFPTTYDEEAEFDWFSEDL